MVAVESRCRLRSMQWLESSFDLANLERVNVEEENG